MVEAPPRVLIWNVHGNYLHALSQVPFEWIVPVAADGRAGYTPPTPHLDWPVNVRVVAPQALRAMQFDAVVYQSTANLADAGELLGPEQRSLPSVYVEHNPPEPSPTESRHPFRHPRGLLVHVTHFNATMWLAPEVPQRVIEHGVPDAGPGPQWRQPRGLVVINHLGRRGRRLGQDIFERARASVALDLIGMQSEVLGGLGEVANRRVAGLMAEYRYFFTPIRYASLGLSLVQAMLCRLPVVGFAATELVSVI
ncbi:MAG: glycosyltransferase family 1 protein, partial [Pigmentiphaga sp.]